MKVSSTLVIAGGLALLALLALGIALMQLRSDGTPSATFGCVTGTAAQNPRGDDGSIEGVGAMFETVAEAEAFICLDVPQAQDTGDWFILYALAHRSHSLASYTASDSEPSMSRRVDIRYDNPDIESTVTPTSYLEDPRLVECRRGEGELSTISIRGNEAQLWRRLNAG